MESRLRCRHRLGHRRAARALVASTVAWIGLAAAGAAPAEAQTVEARTAAWVGGRVNLGELGRDFRFADVYGVESAADWTTVDRSRQIGVAAWFAWARNHATSTQNVEDQLSLFHLGLGLRAGLRLPLLRPTDLVVVVGPELLRSNSPVPPEERESFVGVRATIGADLALSGAYYLTMGVGFGAAPSGPASVSVFLALGAWGR